MSPISKQAIQLHASVPTELGGQRLDQVAAQVFPEHSRSRLSAWIKDGSLTVDGGVLRPRDIVYGGAVLELKAEQEAQGDWVAQCWTSPPAWSFTRRPGTPMARCSTRCCTMRRTW